MTTEPYRTQIPNIIDDLGLDPFERALYVHYKRTCGENPDGYSNETTETISGKLRMSTGQVSNARKSLITRGLIIATSTRPVVVKIVNIWELNRIYYQAERESRPNIDGWTVNQLKLWSSNIHTVKLSEHNECKLVSLGETNPSDIHLVKLNGNMSSNIHTVKQRSKESYSIESKREREESRSQDLNERELLGKAINDVCEYDSATLTNKTRERLAYALDVLWRKKATPALVSKFRSEYWWGTSPPKPDQVIEEWPRFLSTLKSKEPLKQVVKVSAK